MTEKNSNLERFYSEVIKQMIEIIKKYLSNSQLTLSFSIVDSDISEFAQNILDNELSYDIERFATSDPATEKANDRYKYVFESCRGMRAILYYRIANHLIYKAEDLLSTTSDNYKDPLDEEDEGNCIDETKNYLFLLARKITEDATVITGVEINPSARIGKGLVIDHGFGTSIMSDEFGTVIGETCEIGENCTILNGVTLGASDVNKGPKPGRRHPKIGSDVTICANARVLGKIVIGDRVYISPFSVITHDIPSDYTVSIVNQLQLERNESEKQKILIYGVVPDNDIFYVYGRNLSMCSIAICNSNNLVQEDEAIILYGTDTTIKFKIPTNIKTTKDITLCINNGKTRVYYLRPQL